MEDSFKSMNFLYVCLGVECILSGVFLMFLFKVIKYYLLKYLIPIVANRSRSLFSSFLTSSELSK